MTIEEILTQAYYSGTLALSIALLAVAILIYPTLKKHTLGKKRK